MAVAGEQRYTTYVRNALKVASAWIPFWAIYALVGVVHAGLPTGESVFISTCTVGSAAVLALGVWWITGRYPWPARLRISFYLAHLVLGLLYAAAWLALYDVSSAVLSGKTFTFEALRLRMLGWNMLMGLWLYGLVAGVSYAVRIRERLLREERIAARAETEAARARLAALRAQLNPHFLFNALHSLGSLIRHDTAAAERAVEELGHLLRYSLDETDTEHVRLAEEWAFTRDYLSLEQLRVRRPLQIATALDDAALECWVPPFTLQPLVENAVRHGVDSRADHPSISITGSVEPEALCIQVCDNGPGAASPDLANAEGLGLRSLRARLAATYGERASLTFQTAPGKGFCATVRLPLDRSPAEP